MASPAKPKCTNSHCARNVAENTTSRRLFVAGLSAVIVGTAVPLSLLEQNVVARAAVEHVLARLADQDVVAGSAGEVVIAGPADQDVVAVFAVRGELDRVGG